MRNLLKLNQNHNGSEQASHHVIRPNVVPLFSSNRYRTEKGPAGAHNFFLLFYLCLASTVLNVIDIIKPYLNYILINQRGIKLIVPQNRTSSALSSLVMLNYWRIFLLEEQQVRIPSRTHTELQRPKKTIFPYQRFHRPAKRQKTEPLACDAFYSVLFSCNSLESEYKNYVNVLFWKIDWPQ